MTTGCLTLLLTLGVGATPPDVYTMRNTNLEIPIRINDAKRPDIKELELHVSTDQGRTWTLAGRAKPEQQAFGFHASGDGLYWFSVCAIDKTGRRDPEDIATAKPALKVLIDTSHPALQVVAVDRVGEEVQVAWECSDSQADPASLRLEYRPAGAEPTRRLDAGRRSSRNSSAPTASGRCTAGRSRCGCRSRTAPARRPQW